MRRSNEQSLKKEKIVFLSHFMSRKTPLYGGKGKVNIRPVGEIKKGSPHNSMLLEFPNHASTHVDLPSHFLRDGRSLSDYKPRFWIFNNVQLVKVKSNFQKKIKRNLFKNLNKRTELLLIKTGLENYRRKRMYYEGYPYLSSSLAAYFKEKMPSLRAVGIDCISISSPIDRKEGRRAHREFLKRGIVLLEDMKLDQLKKSPAFVMVSPLLIKNADGAPATVFAAVSS